MTLRAVHGNRAEALLGALLDVLPPLDPFAPATIVVGSRLVSRWLTREIAIARGVATGLDLVTFDRFVERAWVSDADVRALDRAQLGAAIASVLADDAAVRGMPAVATYLAGAPRAGDHAAPRRVQLATRVADLCWSYAATRPDWMPALLVGHAPGELADDPAVGGMARWQAQLIAEAIRRLPAPGVPTPMLPWARRRAGLRPPTLPPVAVFGMSYFTRAQLEALTDLAQATDVTVFLLDPCRELWDDVASRGKASEDPLPLVLWGRPVRDTLGTLVERTGGDVDDRFVEGSGATARERLLADVLARKAPSGTVADAGVAVLACPNARREIEVVADLVRARLDADPTLRAHEIAVWIAGDADRYLAQAPSALEAVGVPCHLVDAPIDDRGRIGEVVLALLELPSSPMRRRDLLRVMTHPAVLAAYPHVDADDWVRWTDRLGIAHGADGDAHDNTYLAEFRDRFHWDQGVRRLALGTFMAGIDTGGPVRVHDGRDVIELAPEEVRADQQASAATYALLVRSLCADGAWLASHVATLTEWAEIFAGLVDAYVSAPGEEARRDLDRVRAMLAGIAHLDVDGRRVGFREVRAHVARAIDSARSDRGEPLAAGVMIAPLRAMRAVPCRVGFVVGLDEGEFPAGDQPTSLDLRRAPRLLDVSARDRDRCAFLEALLGARDALYLSYVAVEGKSGSPLGPSSVVLELADALAPYLGAPTSKDALAAITTRYPLHRHGLANPPDNRAPTASNRPAIARERWAVTVRDALRAHLVAAEAPIPDEDGLLALLGHASQAPLRDELAIVEPPAVAAAVARARPLTLANLRAFLEYPIQAWAGTVLGLDEQPDDEAIDHSDEPFHVDRPDRTVLLREVFAAWLRDGGDAETIYDATVHRLALRGHYPAGVFAEAARGNDLAILARWREAVGGTPVVVPQLRLVKVDSPGSAGARSNAERCGGAIDSPGSAGARSNAERCGGAIDSPGSAGARSNAERCGGAIDSPGSAGARRKLQPMPVTRIAFGRASSPHAQLLPALELELSGGRTVRLVGQTELLLDGDRRTSVIGIIGKAEKRSRHHLRGALDHAVLAAAGLAPNGHAHVVVGAQGLLRVEHAPWAVADARHYLAALATDLLDGNHGYILPFDALARALKKDFAPTAWGDAQNRLGFGAIERSDGLAPPDAGPLYAMARRRLLPLVEHMRGDHGFEVRP